jgi:hypothetical protein
LKPPKDSGSAILTIVFALLKTFKSCHSERSEKSRNRNEKSKGKSKKAQAVNLHAFGWQNG